MAGGEQQMWGVLRPILKEWDLDPWRIETPNKDGVPDANCTFGWLELKNVEDWPKRVDSILPCPHFTPQQRVWLLKRWTAGGICFLLLRVRKPGDWLLFDGNVAAQVIGKETKEKLFNAARVAVKEPSELILLRDLIRR